MTTINNYENLEMLTIKEVGKVLKISKQQVLILVKAGELPAMKFNSRLYRIKKNDLERYIESNVYQAQSI